VWLSPSVNIFNTQLENLKRVTGFEPKNITFLTYARLMHMSEEEIKALAPTHAVLDEYHRAGAERWEGNVRLLLKTFPDMKVLGLSATPIRYLDNQRDMSDELFDGNVASEMTLGEAKS
jgi:superfamily II DNA or RNA helicase